MLRRWSYFTKEAPGGETGAAHLANDFSVAMYSGVWPLMFSMRMAAPEYSRRTLTHRRAPVAAAMWSG